ncbi:MAG: L-carnitine dehydratase/bile acid-inducible protein [Pseudonocardiales bacterium]|nr:L-carnitine dehydratase/bile acid-inducible protein [Pseudonocardiales bacterium]
MVKRPMEGVRILEVAQFTFVPASGGVLAEWGADVIKVEHAVTGDAQRGLVRLLGLDLANDSKTFFPIMEGPNRAKRSIGLALEVPEGREVLDELIRSADVFVTNFMPSAREKLRINVEDVRAINPDIIYVRGSGFGAQGDAADMGGYDGTAFWAYAGSADASTPNGAAQLTGMPTGAYGDSMGGMTIAGGIAAALYARNTTGEPSIVDVSLLSVGAWATQFSVHLALMAGGPLPKPSLPDPANPVYGSPGNPLMGNFLTADERWVNLCMLQPTRYWSEFCQRMGRPDLITDPRFVGNEILTNGNAGGAIVAEILSKLTRAEWVERMDGAEGQWALVQNTYEVGMSPLLRQNGYVAQVTDADGRPRELIANPVQFDETPAVSDRAPQFAEHTDEVLRELGIDDERLINLKILGACT